MSIAGGAGAAAGGGGAVLVGEGGLAEDFVGIEDDDVELQMMYFIFQANLVWFGANPHCNTFPA